MRIDIITAFPEMIKSVLETSILKIANEKSLVKYFVHNLHDFADNKFRHIDDTPYGGGAGMLIKCQPVFKCIESLSSERKYDEIIYMSADGEPLKQAVANELSLCKNLIILAGHYKGIDQRIRDRLITREISIGDYVLTGGELPALVLIDAIVRLIPGVIGDAESALDDSFMDGLLEPPYYTKPAIYKGMQVPEVLRSGNHKEINEWKQQMAMEKTQKRRPDLLNE
ncbi:tRNA (guanosine(37)-N1)-methyltransferase TrmD [Bacteroidetes/Chlorobi group bacterium ChocPot_Mid]|nr:MAG: tRNA (guanosine(37)-N1)-methyltransferase TrmD [Bacteroidetes/Chlorobi group bacterium ChocPot_Mid]